MWIFELVQEFFDWIKRKNTYSGWEQCKNLLKFLFYGSLSGIILLILEFVDSSNMSSAGYFIYASLKYTIIADFALYILRLVNLWGSYQESHLLLFTHMLVHLSLIANVIVAHHYGNTEDRENKRLRRDLEEFDGIYPLVKVRVFIYFVLLLFTIVISPWLIRTILRERRERLSLLANIRRQRARVNYPIDERDDLHQPLLNHPLPHHVAIQPVLPVDNEEMYNPEGYRPHRPRNSLNDRFINILQGIQPRPVNRDTISMLHKVSYQDASHWLSYEECTICLLPFNDFQAERLIYLPCNKEHIFHSNCIIDWLKQESNCPLWKAPVNQEVMRNANY